MKPTVLTPTYTVYLLHFDKPIGKVQHYVGICKAYRLHARMMDHRNGRGAALTHRAYQLGIGWTITHTWHGNSPTLEKEIKRGARYKEHCTICQSSMADVRSDIIGRHYDPVSALPEFKALDGFRAARHSRYGK